MEEQDTSPRPKKNKRKEDDEEDDRAKDKEKKKEKKRDGDKDGEKDRPKEKKKERDRDSDKEKDKGKKDKGKEEKGEKKKDKEKEKEKDKGKKDKDKKYKKKGRDDTMPSEVSREEFTKIKLLGSGDVGKVYLVRHNKTEKLFAMKVLDKREMIKRNKVGSTSLLNVSDIGIFCRLNGPSPKGKSSLLQTILLLFLCTILSKQKTNCTS